MIYSSVRYKSNPLTSSIRFSEPKGRDGVRREVMSNYTNHFCDVLPLPFNVFHTFEPLTTFFIDFVTNKVLVSGGNDRKVRVITGTTVPFMVSTRLLEGPGHLNSILREWNLPAGLSCLTPVSITQAVSVNGFYWAPYLNVRP